MHKTLPIPLTAALALASAPAWADLELPQASPPAQVHQRVGVTDLSVHYSSPGVKGRKIYGGLVPYEKLWRTGANKATRFETSRDVVFGGKKVKAGAYSVFTVPGAKGWTVVLNANTELWGTGGYDKKQDVVRVTAKPTKIPQRERLTFLFSDTTEAGTRLDLEWDTVRISVPITVDTKGQVLASIDETLGAAWGPYMRAADYLLDNGGSLETALGYVDTSISLKKHWRNQWVKAQILKKMGKPEPAKKLVEAALASGDDSGAFRFYSGQMKDALKRW